jgi:hypothetical protein
MIKIITVRIVVCMVSLLVGVSIFFSSRKVSVKYVRALDIIIEPEYKTATSHPHAYHPLLAVFEKGQVFVDDY